MKQITVVSDDKVGILADISYILGKARVNIESISVQVHGGKGLVNLTVKDDEKATRMLTSNGYEVLASEIFLVKLKDTPGEMASFTALLKKEGVNIESLHIVARGEGFSVHSLKVDKPKKAKKLLEPFLAKAD